jgi:hypothetical protein
MSEKLRREPTALGHSRAIFGDQMLGQSVPGIEVSVIVLVTERPGPLDALYLEYSPAIRATGLGFEFLFAVEPWNRHLTESLDDLVDSGEPIQILQASRTMGEASLLKEAAPLCRGETVLTIPAYHRVQADSLPGIIQAVERGADLAMARRWPRQDNWVNRMQNRVFHWLVAGVGKHKSHDTACGVRALRRDLLNDMPLYGDFFRFLPVLAAQDGYEVTEVACQQHPQDVKTRVYGPATYLRRLIDLLGLFFLARFTYKPLRFFGFFGTSLALPGVVILVVLLIMRLGGEPIGGRPLLLLGVLLLTLGVQAIALGLVGEMIVHLHTHAGRRYRTLEDEEDFTMSSERG